MASHARSGSSKVALQDDICHRRVPRGRSLEQALAVRETFTALVSLWLSPRSFRLMSREIPAARVVYLPEIICLGGGGMQGSPRRAPKNAIPTCSTSVFGGPIVLPLVLYSV
jgi:hypothetical protein